MTVRPALLATILLLAGALLSGCGDDDMDTGPQTPAADGELPILTVDDFPSELKVVPDEGTDNEPTPTVDPPECQAVNDEVEKVDAKSESIKMQSDDNTVTVEFTVGEFAPGTFSIDEFTQTLDRCSSMTLTDAEGTGKATLKPYDVTLNGADGVARQVAIDVTAGTDQAYIAGYIVYATVGNYVIHGALNETAAGPIPADRAAGEGIPFTKEFWDLVNLQVDRAEGTG